MTLLQPPMQKFQRTDFFRQLMVWFAALVSIAIGLAVLAGWQWQIEGLKSVIAGAVEMKANTAVGLVLAGFALLFRTRPDRASTRLVGPILSLAVLLLGLITLTEYLSNVDLRIDQLLFEDTTDAFNLIRGRMSPLTAWSFVLLGISLSLLTTVKVAWVHFLCGPQIIVIGFVSVLGYLWKANPIITDALIPPVAVHTGFTLFLLGIGLFAGRYRPSTRITIASLVSAVELKIMLGMGMVFMVVVGSFGYTYRASLEFFEALKWVQHTEEVRLVLKDLDAELKDTATNRKFFLLTGDIKYQDEFRSRNSELEKRLEKLAKLIEDNPLQLQRLEKAKALISPELRRLTGASALEVSRAPLPSAVSLQEEEGLSKLGEISKTIVAMGDVERDLLAQRRLASERDQITMLASLLVSLGLTALIFLALVLAIRAETARRLRSEDEIKGFNEWLQIVVEDRTAELQEMNSRLNHFTYSLAHDLRQPLISCSGFVSLLVRSLGNSRDPKILHYLKRLASAVGDISSITDAILEIARISRLQVRRQLVDVTEVATEILQKRVESEPDRAVRASVEPNMQIFCDQELLRLALNLLIDNAWKFTGTINSGSIEIGHDESGATRTLWVRDNGVGFDMAYSDKLFAPFSRLHGSEQFSGLGVGLAFVEAAVLRNSAKVNIQSVVGFGTTVYIKFLDQVGSA